MPSAARLAARPTHTPPSIIQSSIEHSFLCQAPSRADVGFSLKHVAREGRVVGLNIARASGVGVYAVPSEAIRPLLAELMSGNLAPKEPPRHTAPNTPPQPRTQPPRQ